MQAQAFTWHGMGCAIFICSLAPAAGLAQRPLEQSLANLDLNNRTELERLLAFLRADMEKGHANMDKADGYLDSLRVEHGFPPIHDNWTSMMAGDHSENFVDESTYVFSLHERIQLLAVGTLAAVCQLGWIIAGLVYQSSPKHTPLPHQLRPHYGGPGFDYGLCESGLLLRKSEQDALVSAERVLLHA